MGNPEELVFRYIIILLLITGVLILSKLTVIKVIKKLITPCNILNKTKVSAFGLMLPVNENICIQIDIPAKPNKNEIE